MPSIRFQIFILILTLALTGSACTQVGKDVGRLDNDGTTASEYPSLPAAIYDTKYEGVDGQVVSLANEKGKVVLLNLWATWCGPCLEEMPALVEMQEKHHSAGFEIIGLNTEYASMEEDGTTIDQLKPMVEAMIREQELNYRNVWVPDGVFDEFVRISKLPGIPQSFLLDRQGRLRAVFAGGGERNISKMRDAVDKLMAEN